MEPRAKWEGGGRGRDRTARGRWRVLALVDEGSVGGRFEVGWLNLEGLCRADTKLAWSRGVGMGFGILVGELENPITFAVNLAWYLANGC